jgi:hypothetical protein
MSTTRRISARKTFVDVGGDLHIVEPGGSLTGFPFRHAEQYAGNIENTFYLIHAEAHDRDWWVLTTDVPRTNQSHEERPAGWLGTTNNVSETAYGLVTVAWNSDGRLRFSTLKASMPPTTTAHIIQSQDNWNEITINVTSEEDYLEDPNRSVGWITSTAHVFSDDFAETDGMTFDGDQWDADIDACLAEMGYRRMTEITSVNDFQQTCKVVAS